MNPVGFKITTHHKQAYSLFDWLLCKIESKKALYIYGSMAQIFTFGYILISNY